MAAPSTPNAPGSPASRVMGLVRSLGQAKRDEISRRTGLSPATVARSTAALVEAGLLRYGTDPDQRSVGRPGVQVRIDQRRFAVIGIHLGRRVTTVALGDLTGRVLASTVEPRADRGGLTQLGAQAARLLAENPAWRPLSAGVVAPWRELGWDRTAITGHIQDLLGLDVADAEHIEAMCTAEFLGPGNRPSSGTSAFIYARETAGFVVASHDGDRVEVSRHSSLDHFPTGTSADCECGRTGCFIASAGERAVTRAAQAAGVINRPRLDALLIAAETGSPGAEALLAERARILVEVVAQVADMVELDRILIAGQAYSTDPRIAEQARSLIGTELAVSRFGPDIQAFAACAIALRPVDEDPLALAPRARRRTA